MGWNLNEKVDLCDISVENPTRPSNLGLIELTF